MIPLPAEVKECLQKSIRLTSYRPFNQLICCISVSSYMLTRRFAVHLNRSLVGLLGIVIEKTDVAYLRSFPCVVVKKTFQVTCGDPETEVDLILSRAGIFETPKDIDDFTIRPTHRSNLGNSVGWIRGSISRCRVHKEVCGHSKGRVKSIPNAYWGTGNWQACTTDSKQDIWKIHITRLLTTLCKITRPVRLRLRLGIGQ